MIRSLFLLVALVLFSATISFAQESTTLEYGEIGEGEITDREYEVPFTFTGDKGDIIVIELKPVDPFGDLSSPQILLLDSEDDIVADNSDAFNIGISILATELPDDGTYTVIATRADGRAGESVGEFTIQIILPEILTVGTPLSGEIDNESTVYYTVINNDEELLLTYVKEDGDFSPEVSINRINDDNTLTAVVTLAGDELTAGALNIPQDRGVFIINLKEALFDFSFETESAGYQLTLSVIE
jgi:hypothetical protein